MTEAVAADRRIGVVQADSKGMPVQQPIAYYNCWRSERDNQIVRIADAVVLAANHHAYAVLNPRTGTFGVLHDTEATARPDASGVIGPGEPYVVAQLHPAHCPCSGGNRIVPAELLSLSTFGQRLLAGERASR
jgi:hypothetical protein